jgi:hypothetical protein
LLGGREPLVVDAGKPIVERLSAVAGFGRREPRQRVEKEASDDDKRREPEQAG